MPQVRPFRSYYRLANIKGVDKLVCELCEEEDAKKPAYYSTTATSKLKTHVESNHSATLPPPHCVWNLHALSVCCAPRGDHALLLRL